MHKQKQGDAGTRADLLSSRARACILYLSSVVSIKIRSPALFCVSQRFSLSKAEVERLPSWHTGHLVVFPGAEPTAIELYLTRDLERAAADKRGTFAAVQEHLAAKTAKREERLTKKKEGLTATSAELYKVRRSYDHSVIFFLRRLMNVYTTANVSIALFAFSLRSSTPGGSPSFSAQL